MRFMKAHQLWLVAVLVSVMTIPAVAEQLPVEGRMPSLARATAWLNSEPLSPEKLRGKVVLVDFWTYTCINWIRTAPYVRAWAEKYEKHGLVVIGVHTPEFSFERDIGNVRQFAKVMKIDHAIAVDSDYAIWNAFNNRYWPALYFVDAQGRIRHHQFGEGNYEQSEAIIQQLLTEAGHTDFDRKRVSVDARGAEAQADWSGLGSPETYVGYARSDDNFASPGGGQFDRPQVYAAPTRLQLNDWALAGRWTLTKEYAALNGANGRLSYRFHARDLHLVMAPAKRDTPVRFRVLIDGQPPGASHGVDVDAQGNGKLVEPRMYQLIRQPGPIEDRLFEIEFLDPGAEVFAFTFG
jgi:thiol-disulfide isomerase/thioredoxin